MKVCLLSSMHPPQDKRVFDKEAVTLASVGHEVMHLCPGIDSEAGVNRGVKIITYPRPYSIKDRLWQLFRLYGMAKKINADVYHCNEVDSWVVGVFLNIFRNKRCLFDVHEHYPSTFAESRFPRWFQPVVAASIRLVFRVLTPFTDRVILAKKTVGADFLNADSKKVLVRNFTPLSGLNFAGRRSILKKGDMVTLLHLGLFSKIRGWPQLLKSMDLMKYKNVRLEVIGEFHDGTRSEFDASVKKYGLADRVVVYDWMPFDQAFQHLLGAHIGLVIFQPGILNHVYAMPHKMFDYMAAGMAVVCPDFAVEVAPFVEESGCGVLVDPSDAHGLASKLDELVASPETINELGARGQQAVRERYNWEAEAERLVQMYKDLEAIS
ncbi:glycosyltransferase [Candidatus Parcubacteria bacterium]|nr:MAG: glycosyltransferase [Candidatus Parcubacteria bacterium]